MMDAVNTCWVMPSELQELALGGDKEVVEELIVLFKEDVSARLQVLREAVLARDIATVGAQAHTIKGSAIQMGAGHLVATCRHLELDAAHHVAENFERLLMEAEAEFAVLQTTMRS